MGTSEDENLKLFYRSMTTEEILTYRAALSGDENDASSLRRRGWRATHAFAQTRRRLLAEVLKERGVEALN